jgi:quaternary ammonium compound-resistance protein SugE
MGRIWVILVLAGLFEVAWAVMLKHSAGFTRLWPSIATLALLSISFVLLAMAMRELPAGTAYAVWTGIGAVGVAIVGMVMLGEPASWRRIACIGLIVLGIVGLKLTTPPEGGGRSAGPTTRPSLP